MDNLHAHWVHDFTTREYNVDFELDAKSIVTEYHSRKINIFELEDVIKDF
jgi:hypothetical protein